MSNDNQKVDLKCGHYVVFTIESLQRNGYPTRWWCNVCRVASDVTSASHSQESVGDRSRNIPYNRRKHNEVRNRTLLPLNFLEVI
jgi:hypothetical protein